MSDPYPPDADSTRSDAADVADPADADTASGGRFTEAAMTAAMRHIAHRLDVSAEDARLSRLTNNAVFALPAAELVIRITRSHGLHARVHKVVRLGTWFEEADAPAIRLAAGIEQPLEVNVRLDSVVRGDTTTRWTPFAALRPSPR